MRVRTGAVLVTATPQFVPQFVNVTGWWAVRDLSDGGEPALIALFLAKTDATTFRAKCLLMEPGHRFSLDPVVDDA